MNAFQFNSVYVLFSTVVKRYKVYTFMLMTVIVIWFSAKPNLIEYKANIT